MIKDIFLRFKDLGIEYISYKKRICHSCGKKLGKNEGWESYSSYILYCDDCFNKIEKGK